MKVLLVGAAGNMGRRYWQILSDMGHQVIPIDQGHTIPIGKSIDKCLIASSTETHVEWSLLCQTQGIDYLCEKPITMTNVEMLPFLTGSMVCNWVFVGGGDNPFHVPLPDRIRISYQNAYTGPHGKVWDCIQLFMLDNNLKPDDIKIGPWNCWFGQLPITMDAIRQSYILMMDHWLRNSPFIVSIAETLQVHRRCYEWSKAGCGADPVQERQQ